MSYHRCQGLHRSADGGICMPSLEDSHAAFPLRSCPGLYSSTKLMKESLQAKYVMNFLAQILPASSSDLSDVHHRKGLISAFHS